MGLLREDGTPKRALRHFERFTTDLGLSQWFHFEDPRLAEAVRWMKRLNVSYLRTGLSSADSFRPNALDWFDRQREALQDFQVTVTFCFTLEHRGLAPHHISPPLDSREFAEFCAGMIRIRESVRTGLCGQVWSFPPPIACSPPAAGPRRGRRAR